MFLSNQISLFNRVKSGNFRRRLNLDIHFSNNGNPDETAPSEPSHQDFHCLLSYLFYSSNLTMKQTTLLSKFT